MPAPTNPKKKSLMPSSPLRRQLRAAGHHLSTIVQVGKEGVTDPVLRQLSEALDHHELVKLKVGTESPEDRYEVAEALAERADAQVAQILGRTVLVYRKHPEKPRFEAAPAREARPGREAPPEREAAPRAPGRRKPAPARKPAPPRRAGAARKPAPGRKPASGRKPGTGRKPATSRKAPPARRR